MTAKEQVHSLVEGMSEGQAEELLEELRYLSAAVDDAPLTEEDIASIDRGVQDIRAGRVISLDQYERERGL